MVHDSLDEQVEDSTAPQVPFERHWRVWLPVNGLVQEAVTSDPSGDAGHGPVAAHCAAAHWDAFTAPHTPPAWHARVSVPTVPAALHAWLAVTFTDVCGHEPLASHCSFTHAVVSAAAAHAPAAVHASVCVPL